MASSNQWKQAGLPAEVARAIAVAEESQEPKDFDAAAKAAEKYGLNSLAYKLKAKSGVEKVAAVDKDDWSVFLDWLKDEIAGREYEDVGGGLYGEAFAKAQPSGGAWIGIKEHLPQLTTDPDTHVLILLTDKETSRTVIRHELWPVESNSIQGLQHLAIRYLNELEEGLDEKKLQRLRKWMASAQPQRSASTQPITLTAASISPQDLLGMLQELGYDDLQTAPITIEQIGSWPEEFRDQVAVWADAVMEGKGTHTEIGPEKFERVRMQGFVEADFEGMVEHFITNGEPFPGFGDDEARDRLNDAGWEFIDAANSALTQALFGLKDPGTPGHVRTERNRNGPAKARAADVLNRSAYAPWYAYLNALGHGRGLWDWLPDQGVDQEIANALSEALKADPAVQRAATDLETLALNFAETLGLTERENDDDLDDTSQDELRQEEVGPIGEAEDDDEGPTELQTDDYFIMDADRGRRGYYVGIEGHRRNLGTFATLEEAASAIELDMERAGHFPGTWYVNERGIAESVNTQALAEEWRAGEATRREQEALDNENDDPWELGDDDPDRTASITLRADIALRHPEKYDNRPGYEFFAPVDVLDSQDGEARLHDNGGLPGGRTPEISQELRTDPGMQDSYESMHGFNQAGFDQDAEGWSMRELNELPGRDSNPFDTSPDSNTLLRHTSSKRVSSLGKKVAVTWDDKERLYQVLRHEMNKAVDWSDIHAMTDEQIENALVWVDSVQQGEEPEQLPITQAERVWAELVKSLVPTGFEYDKSDNSLVLNVQNPDGTADAVEVYGPQDGSMPADAHIVVKRFENGAWNGQTSFTRNELDLDKILKTIGAAEHGWQEQEGQEVETPEERAQRPAPESLWYVTDSSMDVFVAPREHGHAPTFGQTVRLTSGTRLRVIGPSSPGTTRVQRERHWTNYDVPTRMFRDGPLHPVEFAGGAPAPDSLERERVEAVFGLGGGELHDHGWRGVSPWWFDGCPEGFGCTGYEGDDEEPDWDYRTAVTDYSHGEVGSTFEDEEGVTWQIVSYIGPFYETDCPWCGAGTDGWNDEEQVETGAAECPLCEGDGIVSHEGQFMVARTRPEDWEPEPEGGDDDDDDDEEDEDDDGGEDVTPPRTASVILRAQEDPPDEPDAPDAPEDYKIEPPAKHIYEPGESELYDALTMEGPEAPPTPDPQAPIKPGDYVSPSGRVRFGRGTLHDGIYKVITVGQAKEKYWGPYGRQPTKEELTVWPVTLESWRGDGFEGEWDHKDFYTFREGEPYEDFYAAFTGTADIDDGYLFAVGDSRRELADLGMQQSPDEPFMIAELNRVPVELAFRLFSVGEDGQEWRDGYEAGSAAAPYVNDDSVIAYNEPEPDEEEEEEEVDADEWTAENAEDFIETLETWLAGLGFEAGQIAGSDGQPWIFDNKFEVRLWRTSGDPADESDYGIVIDPSVTFFVRSSDTDNWSQWPSNASPDGVTLRDFAEYDDGLGRAIQRVEQYVLAGLKEVQGNPEEGVQAVVWDRIQEELGSEFNRYDNRWIKILNGKDGNSVAIILHGEPEIPSHPGSPPVVEYINIVFEKKDEPEPRTVNRLSHRVHDPEASLQWLDSAIEEIWKFLGRKHAKRTAQALSPLDRGIRR